MKMKRIFLLVLSIFLIAGIGQVNANTCPFTIEMDIGTKHEQVTLLQDFMKNILLIYEGPTTGYFGSMSASGIKVFQENSGLLQTGKVDSVTKAVLCQIYNSYNVNKNITTPSQTTSGECFIKTLGLSRGYFDKAAEEVVQLQKYLNQKGVYPENITSGYFGILTEVALKKFQSASGIPNSGIVDNQTFKAICGYESSQTIGCPFVTNNLAAGFFEEANNEVKTLQMILVKLNLLDSQYQTGFFGKITTDAVKKFQEKTNLAQTGILNIETRTVLCDMIEMPLSATPKSDNPKETQSSNVDIAISGVNIPVEKIDVNTKVPIIVKAKNIGSEMSAKFKSALYLDDKIEASVETFELKPDQEAIVMAHTWTCKEKGIYALKIFLDNDNQLVEKNKFNNVLVVPINCGNVAQDDFKYICDTAKYQCVVSDKGTMLKEECEKMCKADAQKDLPDLTVIEFKPTKSTVKVGEKILISVVEKNIGKTAAGVHQVSFKINNDAQTGS
jgi:peptidoglycan hydrolase-like protein with peptidoglycan-binding domain